MFDFTKSTAGELRKFVLLADEAKAEAQSTEDFEQAKAVLNAIGEEVVRRGSFFIFESVKPKRKTSVIKQP